MLSPIIGVRFINGINRKNYTFKNHVHDLERGDYVIVDANGSFHVAIVTDMNPPASASKWVVDKINFNMYELSREGEKNKVTESARPVRGFGGITRQTSENLMF